MAWKFGAEAVFVNEDHCERTSACVAAARHFASPTDLKLSHGLGVAQCVRKHEL